MTQGLMQQRPLMISDVLRHAATAHPRREIVSRLVNEPQWRYDFAGLSRRAAQAAEMLRGLGVKPGDRVSSLAWNTHRHLELFYAVPGIGAVLHTANPRLSDEQILYTLNHAESAVLLFDASFHAVIARLQPRLAHVRHYICLSNEANAASRLSYEALLRPQPETIEWPLFDESAGAFLCYTSGTTGNPKGVLFSHRSVILHALAAGLSGAFAASAFDCIMPCQSLYHCVAWGLPFVALINGCKLVMPCEKFDGASLQSLIKAEGVTLSGGVPTIWTLYLAHLAATGEDAGTLDRLAIGGSAVPYAMAQAFEARYGVKVQQIWGMTETSPLGVLSTPTPELAEAGEAAMNEVLWRRQGRLQFGSELRIVDESGKVLPADGVSPGALQVRGPWTIERYFKSETLAIDAQGWFDTGDIATLDAQGFMRITDRAKDVIKSGGEWISSIDVENIAAGLPGVKIAAVIAAYHPKWEERPVLIIEPTPDASLSSQQVLDFLAPHIARWWLPDAVIFDSVPLTATGKIDKKALRARYHTVLASADNQELDQQSRADAGSST